MARKPVEPAEPAEPAAPEAPPPLGPAAPPWESHRQGEPYEGQPDPRELEQHPRNNVATIPGVFVPKYSPADMVPPEPAPPRPAAVERRAQHQQQLRKPWSDFLGGLQLPAGDLGPAADAVAAARESARARLQAALDAADEAAAAGDEARRLGNLWASQEHLQAATRQALAEVRDATAAYDAVVAAGKTGGIGKARQALDKAAEIHSRARQALAEVGGDVIAAEHEAARAREGLRRAAANALREEARAQLQAALHGAEVEVLTRLPGWAEAEYLAQACTGEIRWLDRPPL